LPAIVRSVEAGDLPFEEAAVLENFSSHGLYLRLTRQLAPGTPVSVLLHFSIAPTAGATVACMELRSVVLRAEPRSHGMFGTALRFTGHRFTYATNGSRAIEMGICS
jgi:hypothetical protein